MKNTIDSNAAARSLHRRVRLPLWAQKEMQSLEERVKLAEATLPWTEPGMEWFTLFHPRFAPANRAPEKIFTCSSSGTHAVCSLGPEDCVFVGRGKKPNDQGVPPLERNGAEKPE